MGLNDRVRDPLLESIKNAGDDLLRALKQAGQGSVEQAEAWVADLKNIARSLVSDDPEIRAIGNAALAGYQAASAFEWARGRIRVKRAVAEAAAGALKVLMSLFEAVRQIAAIVF